MIEEVEVALPEDLDPFFILGVGKEPKPELHFYEGGTNAPTVEMALEMLSLLSEKLFESLTGKDREAFLRGFKLLYNNLKIMAENEKSGQPN